MVALCRVGTQFEQGKGYAIWDAGFKTELSDHNMAKLTKNITEAARLISGQLKDRLSITPPTA